MTQCRCGQYWHHPSASVHEEICEWMMLGQLIQPNVEGEMLGGKMLNRKTLRSTGVWMWKKVNSGMWGSLDDAEPAGLE